MKTPAYLLLPALLTLLVLPACKKSLPAAGGNRLTKTTISATGNAQALQIDSFVYNNQNQLTAFISASGVIG
jgi:hypothetical protein